MSVPRIVVAGATSGVGKTSVTLAIINSLVKKGYRVQPFKVGPDFIDPSYHTLVSRRQSRNLDVWLMGEDGILECFHRASEGADIAVIEGVMGLFDGMSGLDNFASTAHVASILRSPVILVIDAGKAARSIAAILLGFVCFDSKTRIAGVILNNVASDRHAQYLKDAIQSKTTVPVLGVIRRDSKAQMSERHLGLVPTRELDSKKKEEVLRMSRTLAEQIAVDKLIDLAGTDDIRSKPVAARIRTSTTNIGVALDESFNFYYQDNLDALRRHGARLVFFSPVNDSMLPQDLDGIIIGGGFPEVLADRLAKNTSMMKSIRNNIEGGMPVYGECGGLMYLTRSIRGYKGSKKKWKMIGLIDAETTMTGTLTLNYTQAECDGPLFGRRQIQGHEFHYSKLESVGNDSRFAYRLSRGLGITNNRDGIIVGGNGLASYSHLHFAARGLAEGLVSACRDYSRR